MNRYDVAIIGSSFSGSTLAWILAKQGRRVALIDAAQHPRFAIGESSTPIADRILARLGNQYGIPALESLSSFGAWQRDLPQLVCGKKRGFSYFDHRPQRDERSPGEHSLLVAASPTDERSDTHWLRSDVDAYLFHSAVEAGATAFENTRVVAVDFAEPNRVWLNDNQQLDANYVIDASGRAQVLRKLRRRVDMTYRLQTKTHCSFAHLENVGSFSEVIESQYNDSRGRWPFDADDAAQHHLIQDGWVWMLRLNNGTTSVGVTSNAWDSQHQSAVELLTQFSRYPQLHQIMKDARCIAPSNGVTSIQRIQKLCDPIFSKSCWMLPTTALTLDPLHSTGIAHALAGVSRVAEILLSKPKFSAIARYRKNLLREAFLLDQLVAMSYRSMKSFERFTAACMVYFTAAIHSEERMGKGEMPHALWLADDPDFRRTTMEAGARLASKDADQTVYQQVAAMMKPWNTVGLFDREAGNRYAYTATK